MRVLPQAMIPINYDIYVNLNLCLAKVVISKGSVSESSITLWATRK